MTDHFRDYFDSNYMGVWSLGGRDCAVTITKVGRGKVGGQNGRKKDSKIEIHFAEFDQPWVCNITNAKTIADMHGNSPPKWVGKRITLWPTTTKFGSDTVECVRVRPKPPTGGSHDGPRSRPVDREQRSKQNAAAGREPSPGDAIAGATTGAELLAALRTVAVARWVDANSAKVWPRLIELCARFEVDINAAEVAVNDTLEAAGAAA